MYSVIGYGLEYMGKQSKKDVFILIQHLVIKII